MSYDANVLRRATQRLEEERRARSDRAAQLRQEAYEKEPRLAQLDKKLQGTMSQLMAAALRRGESTAQAIRAIRAQNQEIQRERAVLLGALGLPEDALDDKPACPKCGDTGWRGAQMCDCLRSLCTQEQIRELLSGIILDLDNYKQIYSALAQYVAEMNRSIVTVTGVSSGVDWFNNVNESKNQSSGVIIAQNGKQLLILTDYSPVKQADDIIVTFNEGTQADASLKEKDETTGLAVIAVELDVLNEDFLKNDITIATLGSSNIRDIAGLPVVALGRPMGINGSLGYGIITSSASESAASDTTYRILQTNIVGSQNAGGVLFNLQGQVIGIITNGKSATDMKNMVCAYGITDLKRHIEKMSNGEKFAYLGLKGVDVTEEANSELGVPYGAYITEVEMDSPAMLAGIQQGDVITGFGERVIISFDEYTNSLLSMKPGDNVELTIMRQSQQEYKEMKFDITLTVLK